MNKNDFLTIIAAYKDEIEQILLTAQAYPISMDEIWKIVRLAAIMNTERGPHYVENLLMKNYKRYHGWIEEQ